MGETASEWLALIVDDSEDTRLLWEKCFQEAGFRVAVARDGSEAVRITESEKPDAVVTDLDMPVMDGIEAATAIRAGTRPATYLIAVTAHAGDGTRRAAFNAGFDDVVTKPVDPTVLVAIVRAALLSRKT